MPETPENAGKTNNAEVPFEVLIAVSHEALVQIRDRAIENLQQAEAANDQRAILAYTTMREVVDVEIANFERDVDALRQVIAESLCSDPSESLSRSTDSVAGSVCSRSLSSSGFLGRRSNSSQGSLRSSSDELVEIPLNSSTDSTPPARPNTPSYR